jgi:hypothetical protein
MKLALTFVLLASPAFADDFVFFKSPTGNINCLLAIGDFAGVRCDMLQLTRSFTRRPADCDLEWGDSFAVSPGDRRGAVACHGDTVIDPGAMVLNYGAAATLGDITCTSEKTGMTCENGRGHGFTISKAKQSLF